MTKPKPKYKPGDKLHIGNAEYTIVDMSDCTALNTFITVRDSNGKEWLFDIYRFDEMKF